MVMQKQNVLETRTSGGGTPGREKSGIDQTERLKDWTPFSPHAYAQISSSNIRERRLISLFSILFDYNPRVIDKCTLYKSPIHLGKYILLLRFTTLLITVHMFSVINLTHIPLAALFFWHYEAI